MLNNASKTAKFFYRDRDTSYPFWRLKIPEEHEGETKIKSKEARKYIFNCLEDMGQVNVPTDLERGELLAEKVDRREFIDLLKRMLTMDQERRITPSEALKPSIRYHGLHGRLCPLCQCEGLCPHDGNLQEVHRCGHTSQPHRCNSDGRGGQIRQRHLDLQQPAGRPGGHDCRASWPGGS